MEREGYYDMIMVLMFVNSAITIHYALEHIIISKNNLCAIITYPNIATVEDNHILFILHLKRPVYVLPTYP